MLGKQVRFAFFGSPLLFGEELQDPVMPQFEVRELEPLIDSSAMGPADWNKIAQSIERNYMKYDGFVAWLILKPSPSFLKDIFDLTVRGFWGFMRFFFYRLKVLLYK